AVRPHSPFLPPPSPPSTLFPYTTLFRSGGGFTDPPGQITHETDQPIEPVAHPVNGVTDPGANIVENAAPKSEVLLYAFPQPTGEGGDCVKRWRNDVSPPPLDGGGDDIERPTDTIPRRPNRVFPKPSRGRANRLKCGVDNFPERLTTFIREHNSGNERGNGNDHQANRICGHRGIKQPLDAGPYTRRGRYRDGRGPVGE